jgi:hypothetical protein
VPHAGENVQRTPSLNNKRRGDIKGMDLDGEFAQDLELVKERLFAQAGGRRQSQEQSSYMEKGTGTN